MIPNWLHLTFQDSASPSIEHILTFHDHTITILILITILTLHLVSSMMATNNFNNYTIESQEIETIWTILPGIILVFIAIPSLNTLYLIEDTNNPILTINVNAHQWYWSYEYAYNNSTILETFIENSKITRLLNNSELLNVPCNISIRTLISSSDVIHSWALPSIGIKVDALPGRINQTFLLTNRIGLYTGQCSEICGINHSFIPITINAESTNQFINNIN